MILKKILICGGTGFVGSEIAKALIDRQKSVRILARKKAKNEIPGAEYTFGDVFEEAALDRAMKDCDTVINAVQFNNAPFENPSKGQTYEKVDAEGTEAIVRAAKRNNLSRMLYMSGAGTEEGKTETWFKAKWRAETAIRNSGMTYTIFRPSWMYGPHDQSLNKFARMIRLSPIVWVLGSGYKIQPLYVKDMANLVSKAVDLPTTYNQIYQVGGPQALTMKEVLQCVTRVLHKKRIFVTLPKSAAAPLFSFLEILPGVPITRDALDFLTMDVSIPVVELERVKKDFGMTPHSLENALKMYL